MIAAEASESYASAIAPQLGAILSNKNPGISQEEINQVLNEFSLALNEQVYEGGFYEEVFWPLYDEYFTLEELRSIVSFNKSAAGQKLLELTVPLTIEGEKLSAILVQERMPKILEALKVRVREKGLDLEI